MCSCALCSCALVHCAMHSVHCAMSCACKCQMPHGLSTDQVADKLIGRPECQARDSFKIGCFWHSIANRSADQPQDSDQQITQSECKSANQNADQQTRVQIRMPISSQSECKSANQNANQQIKHATTRPSSQPSNRVPAAESRKSCGRQFLQICERQFLQFLQYLRRKFVLHFL